MGYGSNPAMLSGGSEPREKIGYGGFRSAVTRSYPTPQYASGDGPDFSDKFSIFRAPDAQRPASEKW